LLLRGARKLDGHVLKGCNHPFRLSLDLDHRAPFQKRALIIRASRALEGEKAHAWCVAFSPDSKWLVTGGWPRTLGGVPRTDGGGSVPGVSHSNPCDTRSDWCRLRACSPWS
jgi:hypothetical protein